MQNQIDTNIGLTVFFRRTDREAERGLELGPVHKEGG